MSFTSQEIREAIDAFLNFPVEVPTLNTGARDILMARDRAFDLLTNALVGDPNSVYHLAWLASNKLYGLLAAQQSLMLRMRRACIELRQSRFRPIAKLDELVVAQTALLETDAGVEGALSGASGPGVGRFQRAVRTFVGRELVPLLPSVDVDDVSTISNTPANLRQEVQQAWSLLKNRDAEIKELLDKLENLLVDFEKLRLPERSVQILIKKLRVRTDEILEHLSSSDAEEAARGAYLDLLVMDAILGRTSEFSSPVLVLGQGSDAVLSSPVYGPVATSSLSGPYALTGEESFEIIVDGVSELVLMPRPSKDKLRAQDVAEAINAASSVTASVQLNSFTTTAHILDVPGSENKLYPALHSSSVGIAYDFLSSFRVADWISDEAFEAATKVLIGSGVLGGTYTITSRDPETRIFQVTPAPASSDTGLDYILIGPAVDGVNVGDKVDISDPANVAAGSVHYEVAAVGDEITLDSDIQEYATYDPINPIEKLYFSEARVEFFTEYLVVTGPPGASLEIPSNSVSELLGLDESNLQAPISTGKSTSVQLPSISSVTQAYEGDTLELNNDEHVVVGVTSTSTGLIVGLQEPVDYSPVQMSYSYLSGRYRALQGLLDAIGGYPQDVVTKIDVLVAQIVHGKSADRIVSEIEPVISALDSLLGTLKAYKSPGRSRALDAAVTMMREQGMDRAADLLISLQLTELFTMNRDGVSYNTNLARTAATATRVVSPVSKSQSTDEDVISTVRSDSGISR